MDTQPQDAEAVLSGQQARRPVAWLLLRPAHSSPAHQRQPQRAIALPISCDASLPDYMVKTEVFEKGMKRHWHKQDRFRMFFASSYANKAGQAQGEGIVMMHGCTACWYIQVEGISDLADRIRPPNQLLL